MKVKTRLATIEGNGAARRFPFLGGRFGKAAGIVGGMLASVAIFSSVAVATDAKETAPAKANLETKAVVPAKAPAKAWPLFRGNVEMTGVSASALPEKLVERWNIELKGPIHVIPAIENGVVYVPTMDGFCYAISLASGKQLWRYENPEMDGSESSPCLTPDLVVYGDEAGFLRALDRKNGLERWSYQADDKIICSPTLIGDKILVGSYDMKLYCFEAATGKLVWSMQTDGPIHCSPTKVGDSVAVAGCDGYLRLVSIADGKQQKELEIGGNIASTPALVGDRLFFGTMGGEVLGIDHNTMQVVWTFRGDKGTQPYQGSPAVDRGLVVIGGRDKFLHAIGTGDGKEAWSFRTRARIDCSPVVVGNRVFSGSKDGTLYGLDLATGKKVWESIVGGEIVGGPAVAEGLMVVGDADGRLVAFGSDASTTPAGN